MAGWLHAREFKLHVVRQIAGGEKQPAQICREYQLVNCVLARWRTAYAARYAATFTPRQDTEQVRLQARSGELERYLVSSCSKTAYKKPWPRLYLGGYAVIREVHQQQPDLLLRYLCLVLGVNQAWYKAARPRSPGAAAECATAVRDAITVVTLELSGYGD